MTITKTEKYMISNTDGGYYNEIEEHEDSVTIGSPDDSPVDVPIENLAEVVHVLQGVMEKRGIPTV
jgi:hypothetical protein